ncbi:enhancer of rudimentary domain-containing protein [Ditylenchus destructor]|nr:enhancer of rudimentary domain-containing protein [Ditylenchus destructor]
MANHTILLIQSSSKVESRTWSDYESSIDAMEAICKIYEEHLKKLNPDVPCIQYDVSDLFKFIDRLADLSCMVADSTGQVYIPKGKDYIKEQIFVLLRGQAGNGR